MAALLGLTEEEWNTCEDAAAMLRHLGARAGERKLRLLAAACARVRWSESVDAETVSAVELAERCADGEAVHGELRAAVDDLWDVAFVGALRDYEANVMARSAGLPSTIEAVSETIAEAPAEAPALIRDIFGNPFREAVAAPDRGKKQWRALAKVIYEERRFEEMPRLARMLGETNKCDRALIEHLSSPGPHVRGCWALDVLLGKSPGKDIVTDADWLGETYPFRMLNVWRYLRGEVSPRKLRLIVCACCRLFPPLVAEGPLLRAVEVAEAFANGRVEPEALDAAHEHASAISRERGSELGEMAGDRPGWAALCAAWKAAGAAASATEPDGGLLTNAMHSVASDGGRGRDTEDAEQTRLIREVLGNPLRQAVTDRTWVQRDGAIREIAEEIEKEKAFTRLPALDDRLEKAGCSDASILAHLREPGPHVPGCWALDELLGR